MSQSACHGLYMAPLDNLVPLCPLGIAFDYKRNLKIMTLHKLDVCFSYIMKVGS